MGAALLISRRQVQYWKQVLQHYLKYKHYTKTFLTIFPDSLERKLYNRWAANLEQHNKSYGHQSGRALPKFVRGVTTDLIYKYRQICSQKKWSFQDAGHFNTAMNNQEDQEQLQENEGSCVTRFRVYTNTAKSGHSDRRRTTTPTTSRQHERRRRRRSARPTAGMEWPDLVNFVTRFYTNSIKTSGKIAKSGHFDNRAEESVSIIMPFHQTRIRFGR